MWETWSNLSRVLDILPVRALFQQRVRPRLYLSNSCAGNPDERRKLKGVWLMHQIKKSRSSKGEKHDCCTMVPATYAHMPDVTSHKHQLEMQWLEL